MSDREESDVEADLSKKERLINAWIAVGPNGKTTDVSELTGSSRGYASDIRRAMGGDEDGEDELPFEDVRDAYEPDLVERYRAELPADERDGGWEFTDRLPSPDPEQSTTGRREPPGPASGEPVSRSRAGSDASSRESTRAAADNPPDESASASTRSTHERTPQQPDLPESGAPGAQAPPRSQPPSGWESHGQSPPPGGQAPRSGGPGQQPGGRGPPGRPNQGQGGPPPQPNERRQRQGGQGQWQPTGAGNAPQPPQGGQPSQSAGGGGRGPQGPEGQQTQPGAHPPRQVRGGLRDRLAELDRDLEARQRQANAELASLPQQSQAYAIAVSKYNLVVEVRESLRDLAQFAPGP